MKSAKMGNYERAASQMLRALRGMRSQRAFARRLGYAANPITDWEHGRRFPTAQEMLYAALIAGVDVEAAIARFHSSRIQRDATGRFALESWLDSIRGSTPAVDLAERTGLSRFAVGRFLRGDAQPRVPDFFRMLDAATGRLPDFIAAFVSMDAVPSMRRRYEAASAARRAAYEAPWTEAILRVLETVAYQRLPRHEDVWVARQLGISLAEVKASLQLLRKAGAIRRKQRLLTIVEESSVDTRGEPDRVTALLSHWSGVATSRVATRRKEDFFAYNVCSLSTEDYDYARTILRDAFREIRSLVSASHPVERVALVNVQLVHLDQGEMRKGG